jgi:hypothetical protein
MPGAGDGEASPAPAIGVKGMGVAGGYRIYESDIRIALAWAHLAAGDPSAARAEAERARQMSAEMSYHWGQVDAAKVMAAMG